MPAERRPAATRLAAARQMVLLALAGVLAGCAPGAGAPSRAYRATPDPLTERLAEAARISSGRVGVGALHLESGRRVSLRGRERFSMASVYKLPIALALLHRVDRGELRLDSTVTIAPADFAPAYSPLAEGAGDRPVSRTVGQLLELMLGGSDNTASDALLRLAGGPPAVTRRLRELGVRGLRVDRTEREIALAQSGLDGWPAGQPWSRKRFEELAGRVPEERRRAAEARFSADPRDTATPEGMVDLLALLQRGSGLSPASRDLALRIMTETPTGPNRLRGRLPRGTAVAHKTGTWASGMATNDVGIVTLPAGRGHLALAVFITDTRAGMEEREAVIAEAARVLFEHFADRPASH